MLTFRIALRYLFSKKSHNAVNVISIISMIGVGVAAAAILCVLSVFNGFSDLAVERMSGFDPQVKVEAANGKKIYQADSLALQLQSMPQIAMAMPTIKENALAIFDGGQMAVDMHGLPAGYDSMMPIESAVIDGEYLTANTELPVATLSVGTAMRLKAYPGTDRMVSVYVPKRTGKINAANPMNSFKADSLFVGGVVRFDDAEVDQQSIYVPIEMARNLLEYNRGEASAIELMPASGVTVKDAVNAVKSKLGDRFKVLDRYGQEEESFRMISVEKWITFMMLAFILVIASFNIISTMSMLIIEKRSDMTTLRSMGATASMVRNIFMWEGWLITTMGGVAGALLGVALSYAQQMGGFIKLNGDPTQLVVDTYPVRVMASDFLLVVALVAVTGLIVGWLTSRFAARK
ncbi:MAG: FtsX-like permease family protein [Bacteroides sp.]|nr:FtsX-like permease family protein [Bacteroides sp.]MCM1413807.1 FtsX-like permease family protein [Bacteroides sp.]MCM1471249.1 FtsX-like permease family protein [Bacteroides sp.]